MKKKVVFFINGLYGGGAEKVLQTILHLIDRDKYDITLYSVLGEELSGAYPSDINFRTIYKSTSGGSFNRLLSLAHNKIALLIYSLFPPTIFYTLYVRGNYDVEIAFIEGYSTRIVSGSTNRNSKKIAWVHIDLSANHWSGIAYHNDDEERNCYRKFDIVVAVSSQVKSVNEKIFPGIKQSICIYNPVDSDEILNKASECGYHAHTTIRLVSSGRFTQQKSFDRLLRVVKRLVEENYNIDLWLFGDGQLRCEYEDFIKKNNLSGIVTLWGFQKNPYQHMKSCDIFICSSVTEGFSTVITEALIMGLPVVSTDVPGIYEQLGENSEYGIITENDEIALYNGIKALLDNRYLLEHYKNKSQERGKMFRSDFLMSAVEAII